MCNPQTGTLILVDFCDYRYLYLNISVNTIIKQMDVMCVWSNYKFVSKEVQSVNINWYKNYSHQI